MSPTEQIFHLIEKLKASAGCALKYWHTSAKLPELPDFLPQDLQTFCSVVEGGDLYYREDPHVPQLGVRLTLRLTCPINGLEGSLGVMGEDLVPYFPRLSSLYELAEYPDESWYYAICIDLAPQRFGRMYMVAYNLGDAAPFLRLVGRSFAEWLENLIEVGRLHAEDWREAIRLSKEQFNRLESMTDPLDELG